MIAEKQKIILDKKSVSITLFVPLCPKAMETKHKKPIIIDNKAVEIINSIDFDIKPYLQKRTYHAAIVRTWIIDKIVNEFINKFPDCTILNLGCGLDTRISRLDNGILKWYDVDFPDVIDLRRKFFVENERIKFISKSIMDYSWFDDIKFKSTDKILIISEGLFPYFYEKQIIDIFFAKCILICYRNIAFCLLTINK